MSNESNTHSSDCVPYGVWRSPVSVKSVAQGSVVLSDLSVHEGRLYWLESRPQEGGRQVIMTSDDGIARQLTPDGFDVRSRVHEIGGAPYTVAGQTIYFSNFADQRLYSQEIGRAPAPLTPEGYRYADFAIAPGNCLICVRQDHSQGAEAKNAIVAVSSDRGGAGRILFGESDFVAYPRLSRSGHRLAWIAWRHPHMPWEETTLYIADLNAQSLSNTRSVAGGAAISAIEPQWDEDDGLLFMSDESGFWNLHLWREGIAKAVLARPAEFARPLWWLGQANYAQLGAGQILARYSETGRDHLVVVNITTGATRTLRTPFVEHAELRALPGRGVVSIAASERDNPAITCLDIESGEFEMVYRQAPAPVETSYVSVARPIVFSTEGKRPCHALSYRPTNPSQVAPADEKPPLIIQVHGGPTLQASAAFNLSYQFWTSRGFALLDLNYGGSAGFGREYRQRLNGNWGVVELQDISAAVNHLIAAGEADPRRVVIRGASAGGFAVLGALSKLDLFAAGACYFGISDLEILLRDTHKFQSRYLYSLLGPYPAAKVVYRERSPIHNLERFKTPLILFQGAQDLITPPNQAHMIRDALRERGLPVTYIEFADEGHGFRRTESIVDALNAELNFYQTMLGLRTETTH